MARSQYIYYIEAVGPYSSVILWMGTVKYEMFVARDMTRKEFPNMVLHCYRTPTNTHLPTEIFS